MLKQCCDLGLRRNIGGVYGAGPILQECCRLIGCGPVLKVFCRLIGGSPESQTVINGNDDRVLQQLGGNHEEDHEEASRGEVAAAQLETRSTERRDRHAHKSSSTSPSRFPSI